MPSRSRSRSRALALMASAAVRSSTGAGRGWPHGRRSRRRSCRTRARSRSGRSPRASSRSSSGGAAGPRCGRRRRRCSLAAIAAVVIAVVVYYAHFLDTYRTELARIGGETAAAAPDAGGRGIGDRLASVPRYLQLVLRRPGARARCLGRGDPLVARRARSHDARHGRMAADVRAVPRARHPHAGRHAVLPGRRSGAGDLCGRRQQHRLDIGRPARASSRWRCSLERFSSQLRAWWSTLGDRQGSGLRLNSGHSSKLA